MLDGLHGVFALLKERIEQHRDILSRNEAATRYALIDPLLTALGWNLADPAQVQVEYNTQGAGYADYVLLAGRQTPQAVIEAKKLDGSLVSASDQAISYCISRAIPYFLVTNGEQWVAYDTFRRVPTPEKRIVAFSLEGESQHAVMMALWLWRGNFEVSDPVVPVIPEPQVQSVPAGDTPTIVVPVASTGISLSAFEAQSGQRPSVALVFPGSVVKPIRRWSDLQAAVVEWLTETGRLTSEHCPLTPPNGSRYLVNVTPNKANRSPFTRPIQAGGLWIDADYAGSDQLRRAREILQARNVDPATIRVQTRS